MTTLTLHQNNQQAEFVEHPIEVARRALMAAAEIEAGSWSSGCLRIAELLPQRGAIAKQDG